MFKDVFSMTTKGTYFAFVRLTFQLSYIDNLAELSLLAGSSGERSFRES